MSKIELNQNLKEIKEKKQDPLKGNPKFGLSVSNINDKFTINNAFKDFKAKKLFKSTIVDNLDKVKIIEEELLVEKDQLIKNLIGEKIEEDKINEENPEKFDVTSEIIEENEEYIKSILAKENSNDKEKLPQKKNVGLSTSLINEKVSSANAKPNKLFSSSINEKIKEKNFDKKDIIIKKEKNINEISKKNEEIDEMQEFEESSKIIEKNLKSDSISDIPEEDVKIQNNN